MKKKLAQQVKTTNMKETSKSPPKYKGTSVKEAGSKLVKREEQNIDLKKQSSGIGASKPAPQKNKSRISSL